MLRLLSTAVIAVIAVVCAQDTVVWAKDTSACSMSLDRYRSIVNAYSPEAVMSEMGAEQLNRFITNVRPAAPWWWR